MVSLDDEVTLSDDGDVIFQAQSVAKKVNELAEDQGVSVSMTDKKVGVVLNRLRVQRMPRTGQEGRRRKIHVDELNRLAIAYGIVDTPQKSSPSTPLVTSSPTQNAESDYEEEWADGREPF